MILSIKCLLNHYQARLKKSKEEQPVFYIAPDDVSKITATLHSVVLALSSGKLRVDEDIDLGDDFKPLKATGYWVGDVIRIDIKVKRL